jgi:D-alanine--poly(phosphoribitol) ligase subunit 1
VRITAAMVESGRPLPIGHPLPGTRVWIADPADPARPVEAGQHGEIVIAGPQVALGYLRAGSPPGTVAPLALPGPFFALSDGSRAYRTGDLGHVDPADGRFYCHGRLDRQIKLHGNRVELEEIETYVRAIPGVGDAAVLPVERDGQPDHLIAFIVPSGEASLTPLPSESFALAQLIRDTLASHLPSYALPRAARLVVDPPLTTSGKLDHRALRDRLT